MNEELEKCLVTLELEGNDIQQLSMKQVTAAFQRLALLTHPDKAGDESTEAFKAVRQAYVTIREHLMSSTSKTENANEEKNFFEENFETFNFPCENKGSFTITRTTKVEHKAPGMCGQEYV